MSDEYRCRKCGELAKEGWIRCPRCGGQVMGYDFIYQEDADKAKEQGNEQSDRTAI